MLSFSEMARLDAIFATNKWEKQWSLTVAGAELFDAVVAFVSSVSESERELIFALLSKYEIIIEYRMHVHQLVKKFLAKADPAKEYHLVPLMPPGANRIKSGQTVLYEAFTFIDKNSHPNLFQYDSPFSPNVKMGRDSIVVFVDDFVGTGTQFEEMYVELKQKRGELPSHAILLVIRIQEEACDLLRKMNVDVIHGDVRPKAISSGFAVGNMSIGDALVIYHSLQNKLELEFGCDLGFGQAEAIISMKRTPDNTLPIFWETRRKGGGKWQAPFPRS